ncbi:MAG: heavy metal translocating P-type ATPase, partial [Sporomusa sp.]
MSYQYLALPIRTTISLRQKTVLEANIRRIPAVISAYVSEAGKLNIYYKGILSPAVITARIQQAGCGTRHMAAIKRRQPEGEGPGSPFLEYRRDAILAGVSLLGWQAMRMMSPSTFAALYVVRSAFALFVARNFIASGVRSVLIERQPNADTLTTTAVLASVLGGKPESSLTLLALSNFAEMLTTYTAERARKHISNLLRLDQQYVWKIEEGGHEVRVAVESLQLGDRIGVHLGEKICVDGRVLAGAAAVDQSSITGEYIPAEKSVGAYVYAGTVLQNGFLEVVVEKLGDDTALARIVHMVEEAQVRRAPVQNFADRMSNMLVPISFIAAGLVYGATKDWQRVLNMLFIDFSCGLKLSTATAISAAIGRAASRGVLVKGGNYIEALAGVDTVVLDKTGTITVGKPQIVAVKSAPGVSDRE